jgi:hypothetical protein
MLMRTAQELEKGSPVYAAEHGDVYAVRAPALLLPHDVPFDQGAARPSTRATRGSRTRRGRR